MKLPFFNKREAKTLGITCDRVTVISGKQEMLVNFQAFVIYDDGHQSGLLAGGLEFNRDELLDMLAMLEPKKTRKKRSQCKNGHPKDAENTIMVGGQLRCRTCYITYPQRKAS